VEVDEEEVDVELEVVEPCKFKVGT